MRERLVLYDWQTCPKEADIVGFGELGVIVREGGVIYCNFNDGGED